MLRIDEQGYRIVGHVHDEVIVEVDADDNDAPDVIKSVFDQAPAWANGLPLRGEGFTTQYYRK
jgi:DNA polymerase